MLNNYLIALRIEDDHFKIPPPKKKHMKKTKFYHVQPPAGLLKDPDTFLLESCPMRDVF